MVAAQPNEQVPLQMTEAEYLQFEEQSDTKHEFVNGKVYAMAGAGWRHTVICMNLGISIGGQLVNQRCTAVSNDLRLKVQSNVSYRYPDLMVVCDAPNFVENRIDTIDNPTLIIEVLSPGTALIDRNEKLREYRQLSSVQEYVLVAQAEARVERFLRQSNDEWLYTDVSGLDANIPLPSIDCSLLLSEVYNKVTFDTEGE